MRLASLLALLLCLLLGCTNSSESADASGSGTGTVFTVSVTKQELVQHTLEALASDNIGKFQDFYIQHDELTSFKAFEGVSQGEYQRNLESAFRNSKKAFEKLDQNVGELTVVDVEEPYLDSYEKNVNVVYFNAIVENEEGKRFKLRFAECVQLPDAIRLSKSIKMESIQ